MRGFRIRDLVHPLYRRLETAVHPLRYLFLEITQRCNLRCRHCGSDCTRAVQRDELSTGEWLGFFDYLTTRFDRRELVLVLTGGEPFCHPELPQLLAGLRARRLTWGLVTNGLGLSARNVALLVEHGVSAVTVSLDGLAPAHDWLRGRDGAFARALRGIETLAHAGAPFFDVVTCVSPRNLGELSSVSALLEDVGVRRWRLFSIFPKGRARDDRELLLTAAELQTLLTFIAAERARSRRRDFHVDFGCEGYMPAALDRAVRDEPYFCRAGISIASVLCDGAIGACPNVDRSLVQGNIRHDDFATVWDERFESFRRRDWLRRGPCAACSEFDRCLGNSLHLYDPELGHTGLCTFAALGG